MAFKAIWTHWSTENALLLPGIETHFLGCPVQGLVIIGQLQNVNNTSLSEEVLGRLRQTDI
jgi:hypothetical protein